jgi:hypothetical protein
LAAFQRPVLGRGFVDASFFGVLFLSGFSDLNSARFGGGFCLESLILAQDERWRRA